MKRLTLVLLTLAAVGAPAQAWAQRQGRGGGGGFGPSGVGLLAQKSIQDELKLTPEQIKSVDEQVAKQREGAGELRDLGREEARAKFQERAKASQAAAQAILKEDKLKRFQQISLQLSGPQAFSDDAVVAALNLTAEQKDKVKTIQDGLQSERRELFQAAGGGGGGGGEEMRKKADAIRNAANEKLLGVLTTEQQAKWKEQTGELFKGEIQRPPGGGRRGAGARRSARTILPAQANASGTAVAPRSPFQFASFKDDDKSDDAKKTETGKSDRHQRSKAHAHRHHHGKPSRAVGKGPGGSHGDGASGRAAGGGNHRWHGRPGGQRGPQFAHHGNGQRPQFARHPGQRPDFARHHGHPGRSAGWGHHRGGQGHPGQFAGRGHHRPHHAPAWEHARHHGPPPEVAEHRGHQGHHHFASWSGHRGHGPGPGHFEEPGHFRGHGPDGNWRDGDRHDGHGRPNPRGDRDRKRSDLGPPDEHFAGFNGNNHFDRATRRGRDHQRGGAPHHETSDASHGAHRGDESTSGAADSVSNSLRLSHLQQSLDSLSRKLQDLQQELRR